MTSYRKFTGGGGAIFKFTNVGDSIEGTFVEMRPSGFKFPNLILDVGGTEKVCSISTGVVSCLEEAFGSLEKIPEGVGLLVRFVGIADKAKPGQQPFKRFEIEVDEETLPEGFDLGVDEGETSNTTDGSGDEAPY